MDFKHPPAKTPADSRWKFYGWCGNAQSWKRGPIIALTECVNAEYPDSDGVGPQWIVSLSANAKRIDDKRARRALSDFGMADAEEDNHHPGVSRAFWVPVDPAHRVECACKDEEVIVTDVDGYTWTTPANPDGSVARARCRGCEYERMTGKPCQFHGRKQVV